MVKGNNYNDFKICFELIFVLVIWFHKIGNTKANTKNW